MAQKPVMMTRDEAQSGMVLLDCARTHLADQINRASGSRSMTIDEKKEIVRRAREHLATAVAMQERIGTVFNLGGY